MTARTVAVVAAVAAIACGRESGPKAKPAMAGADTPEAAVAMLLDAFATGDAAKLERALPTEVRLRGALRCSEGRGPIQQLNELRGKLAGELPRTRGLGFALASMTTLDTRTLEPGSEAAGCEPLEPIEMRVVELELDVSDHGKVDHQRERSVVVALDSRWYVLDY